MDYTLRMRLIAVYAILWGVTGYLFGLTLQNFLSLSTNLSVYCGATNLILGLFALLWIQRSPRLSRLFYQGPREDERGSLIIAFIWGLPIVILFWALVILALGWLTGKS